MGLQKYIERELFMHTPLERERESIIDPWRKGDKDQPMLVILLLIQNEIDPIPTKNPG